MSNLTMEELLRQQEEEQKNVKIGETITAKISKITNEEIRLEMNYGFDGIIKIDQLNLPKGKYANEVYSVGNEITALITKIYHKDGTIHLSKLELDKAQDHKELEKALEEKTIVTVFTTKAIERGVFATYKTQEVFIPISQLDTKFVQNTKGYEGKNLEVYIKEVDKKRNKMVASHRDVLQERLDKERAERKIRIEEEKKAQKAKQKADREAKIADEKAKKQELFDSLEVGQQKEGKVTKIMPYGAFVNIGGIEGLLHVNNLSWDRVENVEDVVKEGQEVVVYILDINKETNKFGVALKDINNDPWEAVRKEVQLDDIISVEVVRVVEKGAIVKVADHVEGFLPISELLEERVSKVTNVVNVGDVINVMVIEFRPRNRKMVVSLKEANREPEEDYTEYLEVEDSLGSLGDLFKDKFNKIQK